MAWAALAGTVAAATMPGQPGDVVDGVSSTVIDQGEGFQTGQRDGNEDTITDVVCAVDYAAMAPSGARPGFPGLMYSYAASSTAHCSEAGLSGFRMTVLMEFQSRFGADWHTTASHSCSERSGQARAAHAIACDTVFDEVDRDGPLSQIRLKATVLANGQPQDIRYFYAARLTVSCVTC